MTDPRETLARIRAQADAATEGLWWTNQYADEWEVCGERDDYGNPALIASEAHGEDAEFIAASRTDVPRLVDALEKVLELHAPKDNGRVSVCCSCEQWIESSDDKACIEYPCPTVTAITQALTTP